MRILNLISDFLITNLTRECYRSLVHRQTWFGTKSIPDSLCTYPKQSLKTKRRLSFLIRQICSQGGGPNVLVSTGSVALVFMIKVQGAVSVMVEMITGECVVLAVVKVSGGGVMGSSAVVVGDDVVFLS